jgi:hypothetical protein
MRRPILLRTVAKGGNEMNATTTLKKRIAVLVIAALMAMSGAAVIAGTFADEASALGGGFGNDFINVAVTTIYGDHGDEGTDEFGGASAAAAAA